MKRNDSTMPLGYQIDLFEAKGKRALSKLFITGPSYCWSPFCIYNMYF